MTGSPRSLEVDAVELRRGERVLVSDLSFRLAPGQLALVTGANGSGKTTLLRTLAGLTPAAAGSIRIAGAAVGSLEPEARGQIAYNGHFEGLKRHLTVEENILFIKRFRGSSESVSNLMRALGLERLAALAVRQLSAGQKRRVALASLRISAARLWLLDEPLTNLDSAGRRLVTEWLDAHLAAGGLAVVATHLADDLRRTGCLLVEL